MAIKKERIEAARRALEGAGVAAAASEKQAERLLAFLDSQVPYLPFSETPADVMIRVPGTVSDPAVMEFMAKLPDIIKRVADDL